MCAVFRLFPSITIKALRPESQAELGWIGVSEELKPCKRDPFSPRMHCSSPTPPSYNVVLLFY